jgi:ditrans,polycis-polyprenyl diphosphate synthase
MAMMHQQLSRQGAIGGLIPRYDLSVRLLGRWDMLDDSSRESLMDTVNESQHRTGGILNLCVAYTSQDEMTRAMRKTVEGCSSIPSSITSQSLTENMDTVNGPLPDILIRTSGVTRLSDFLLWQCHQKTDIQFVDLLWPEFKPWNLFLIIARWQRRKAVSERDQSKRSGRKKISHGPSSAHIQAVSVVLIMFIIFVVV